MSDTINILGIFNENFISSINNDNMDQKYQILHDTEFKLNMITLNIKMALRLLKKLKPPFLTQIKWKSIAECVDFIFANFNELIEKIQSLPKSRKQNYMKLIKFNWKELKDAADIITSFIISMEDDNMRIEFVFIKLFSTISKLNALNNQIAKDILLELLKTYVKNDNLVVSLAAFLLTSDGSLF